MILPSDSVAFQLSSFGNLPAIISDSRSLSGVARVAKRSRTVRSSTNEISNGSVGSRSYCVAGKLGGDAAHEWRVELIERQARLADVALPLEFARSRRGIELLDRTGDEVGRVAVLKVVADVYQLADQLGVKINPTARIRTEY